MTHDEEYNVLNRNEMDFSSSHLSPLSQHTMLQTLHTERGRSQRKCSYQKKEFHCSEATRKTGGDQFNNIFPLSSLSCTVLIHMM